jgi:hypothetical protein
MTFYIYIFFIISEFWEYEELIGWLKMFTAIFKLYVIAFD